MRTEDAPELPPRLQDARGKGTQTEPPWLVQGALLGRPFGGGKQFVAKCLLAKHMEGEHRGFILFAK